jgi:hypothetical protein
VLWIIRVFQLFCNGAATGVHSSQFSFQITHAQFILAVAAVNLAKLASTNRGTPTPCGDGTADFLTTG